MIIHENSTYTAPRDIANIFNHIFLNKVQKLTRETNGEPTIEPRERLRKWLDDRGEPLAEFKLKAINASKLRKILKKLPEELFKAKIEVTHEEETSLVIRIG